MISRAVFSSMTVLTATHSESLRAEMVGRFRAGSTDSTFSKSARRHVEHQADFARRLDGALQEHDESFNLFGVSRHLPRRRDGR